MTDTLRASGGGVIVTVSGPGLLDATRETLERATAAGVAAAVAGKDASTWGPDAEHEASMRLGWLDVVEVSRPLVSRIEQLRDALKGEGVTRVVLAGMGGSSLAPEVITTTYGVELTVLDTTDPGQVQAALSEDLESTVVVVSSKSGGTLETDSHRRAFEQAFTDAGIDPKQRIVVVTDPGSPFETIARDAGYREVFLADPNVGGRYSALTAFGLVPSGLAGVPVGELLDQAGEVLPTLTADAEGNPGLALGAAMGGWGVQGHDKVLLGPDKDSGIKGFGDWAEQLIAESTGKQGKGLLPVVVESPEGDDFVTRDDTHPVTLGDTSATPIGTAVTGPLGAQFLVWEFATAVAGWAIGIDPFDQPNVQESKDNTNHVLDQAGEGPLPTEEPAFTDAAVEVYADPALLGGATSLGGALDALLAAVPAHGYLAVMAYLDRLADSDAARLRKVLAGRVEHPVTFGWGPRFLHSTGQFHKGGPQVGAFLQVTGAADGDVAIPGRPFGFAKLQQAQALGDRQALTSRDRPVVRLHLKDRTAGLRQLLDAAGGS